MGYRELLQALEEEVARQIQERRAEASREATRILDEARSELVARRETALGEERRRLAGEAARALSAARLEQERTLLDEMRRQMAELRREAEARLPSMNDDELLERLVDEVVPELGEEPLVFRVEPGCEPHLERYLRQKHAALAPRATVAGTPDVAGGVEVLHGTRQRLDNTLRSRLENAWRRLEPEIAARLLGAARTAAPDAAAGDEAVAVAGHTGEPDGAD